MGLELVCIESDQCVRTAFRTWCANQDPFPGHFAESKIDSASRSQDHGPKVAALMVERTMGKGKQRTRARRIIEGRTPSIIKVHQSMHMAGIWSLACAWQKTYQKQRTTPNKPSLLIPANFCKRKLMQESPTRKQEMKEKENAIRLPGNAYKVNSFHCKRFFLLGVEPALFGPRRVSQQVSSDAWRRSTTRLVVHCFWMLLASKYLVCKQRVWGSFVGEYMKGLAPAKWKVHVIKTSKTGKCRWCRVLQMKVHLCQVRQIQSGTVRSFRAFLCARCFKYVVHGFVRSRAIKA